MDAVQLSEGDLPAVPRIALAWPGKNGVATQTSAGWLVDEEVGEVAVRPLVPAVRSDAQRPSYFVLGDRTAALASAERLFGRCAGLVYADLPRVEGYDETRAFQVVSDYTWSTWLTVVRQHLIGVRRLMRRDGAIVIQCGDAELPFVRLIADELFGRANYLGPIAWQSHYSPKGGKPTSEIAAIHENLVVYAYERELLGPIATVVVPDEYANPDDDPRGPWQAKQKDAGRDTVKLLYVVPPYRWRVVEGNLPPGLWRVNPFSGVIFGVPTTTGTFEFCVEVSDSIGSTSMARCRFVIVDDGSTSKSAEGVWWLDAPVSAGDASPLAAVAEALTLNVGRDVRVVLRASGGSPFVGEKRPSRGWAFGRQTLVNAILEDRCYFGRDGKAIPEPKKYLRDLKDGLKRLNLSSWWSGQDVGFSQDATKNLNELKTAGVINEIVPAPKPESLLSRIVEATTDEGDVLLELFCRAGDLAAVALKTGRRFLAFAGGSAQERLDFDQCAQPRTASILAGDPLASADDFVVVKPSHEMKSDGFWTMSLGEVVATRRRGLDQLDLVEAEDLVVLLRDLVAATGFVVEDKILPISQHPQVLFVGRSVAGDKLAFGVSAQDFLQASHVAAIASELPKGCVEATLFYFRSADLHQFPQVDSRVRLCRIPVELRF